MTPIANATGNRDLAARAAAMGMPAVSVDGIAAVVDTLVEALKSGYDTSTPREQKSIQRLLDTVDKLAPGAIAGAPHRLRPAQHQAGQ